MVRRYVQWRRIKDPVKHLCYVIQGNLVQAYKMPNFGGLNKNKNRASERRE